MVRFAIRRVLWAIPTLFGISLVVFFLTSLIPEPGGASSAVREAMLAQDPVAFDAIEEQRRQRFLDLPRFFNARPKDVRARALEAVEHLVANDEHVILAAHTLARLGGAALPHVLPKLDNLAPATRGRVAVALAPIGERMGIGSNAELRDPMQAAIFWTRFWEDRSLDFTEPSVKRAISRLARQATELRQRDITQVDTFALPEILASMKTVPDRETVLRLSELAAHATGATVPTEEAPEETINGWSDWWYVHKSDYVTFEGAEHATATMTETRYGKWLARAATFQFGVSPLDGRPIAGKLLERARITFALAGMAMLGSYLLALPLALVSAWRRNQLADRLVALLLFVLYALPTFWVAQLFARWSGYGTASRLVWPSIALTVATIASLSRYQRSAMLEVLGLDYVRTARAKGLPLLRVLVAHALRNAMMPTVTLAGLQIPVLIGGAFIVEEVFSLPGLGYESLRAVEGHDTAWLIATVLLTGVVCTAGLILSDLAYAFLDPRVRELFLRREGAQA